ncbi:DUF445 family protein [Euhalothece natronophila Z-M001]|uniref:DUF445 family protein n=1 Tax=Euhalothece natronophila Z-M001 TaxID=522448 RepID=A0A5B8NI73_9CHRO|nr:DUF445 family protein [Euhalothece natronophila]QDZ38674.1 DUF445 family protein [Euhalothece natronophila Z-M001]
MFIRLTLNFSELGLLLVPPVAGATIGYFTNDIAIKMLFRPYKPLYLGQKRVPFTPGLIPRNQANLAQRVANTIMGSLLTPEELQKIARRLLQPERVKGAISWLLKSSIKQIGQNKQEKSAQVLGNILRDLFSESLPRVVKVLSRREDFLEAQLNQIFDQVLIDFQFTDNQAKQLSDWLVDVILPPNRIRQIIIDLLTDRNIQIIDETFREKSSGTYWVVANLFGLRNTLNRLRAFCLDEKETANLRIEELVVTLEIRARLREWLKSLSLQNLPISTVRQFRKTVRESIQTYLQDKGAGLVQSLGSSIDWEDVAVLIIKRLQSSEAVDQSLEVVSEELSLILERYLEEELEEIITKIIPILSIDEVIINRVNSTTPEELETTVNSIVKNELQAIVNLGGILGFLVGTLQATYFYFS